MATQSNPELQRQVQLNQVVNYSEFLNELARQRHTLLTSFTKTSTNWSGYEKFEKLNKSRLDDTDTLIRDTLRHIGVTDLPTTKPALDTLRPSDAPSTVQGGK